MIPQSASAVIQTAIKAVQQTAEVVGSSNSLVSYTKGFQVEPLVLVDNSLVHDTEIMPDIMQTLQSQFTGFWLQAWDVAGDVESAQAVAVLDRINPDRDRGFSTLVSRMQQAYAARETLYFSKEAYKFGLPSNTSHQVRHNAVENDTTSGVSKDRIHEVSNLAVGKMVNITYSGKGSDGKVTKRDFRVAIRLIPLEMGQETILAMATDRSTTMGFFKRVGQWWDNEIGLGDLIFGLDLIRERKKQLLADKEGIYSTVRARQLSHKRAGIATGQASISEVSNLVVISKETADMMLAKHGIDVDDRGDRNKLMENMQCMIMAVVNRMDMRVTFYYTGVAKGAKMGVNDIRIANRKQSGPDLMDILGALKEGNAPRY